MASWTADTWQADDKWATTDDQWAATDDKWAAADDKWATPDAKEADDKWATADAKADDKWATSDDKWAASDDKWAAQEQAPAADDQAATTNDGWGDVWADKSGSGPSPPPPEWSSWGAGNSGDAKPKGNPAEFWAAQQHYRDRGELPRKEEWELERDDTALFTCRLGSSAGINFNKYESVPVDLSGEKSDGIPAVVSFEEMYDVFRECIPEPLICNVRRCQYTTPTPVQKFAIPVGLVGRDVMCCAQTGSGKTAAFLFPIIGRMMTLHASPVGAMETPFEGPCKPDTLIMTPTRELCIQIYEEAQKFCHRTPYRVARIYGGQPPKDQMWEIAKGADVMVATPGRLKDFIDREIVSVESVFVLVLDEADRMLDMGFEPQIREICMESKMPEKSKRQTMMFSATFPETCQQMAQDFLYNYIWIGVGIVGGAVDTVEQQLVQVTPKDKYTKMFEVLDTFFAARQDKERCLIFVNAKDTAKWLDEQLYEKNFNTGALHGNLTQTERETNLSRFRNGEIEVMIATDVAARGLDIEGVGLVVNYDMPTDIDSYIHRIGRTGRIGNMGKAITFIACDEYGQTCEQLQTLQSLMKAMQEVHNSAPDWLEGLITQKSSESYSWGNDRDMRQKWQEDGSGPWDGWNKTTAAQDEQPWVSL